MYFKMAIGIGNITRTLIITFLLLLLFYCNQLRIIDFSKNYVVGIKNIIYDFPVRETLVTYLTALKINPREWDPIRIRIQEDLA